MTEFDINNIGLKVGLEIHQQLDTKKKLFCDCTPLEEDEFSRKFSRRLRAAKSELGKIDPAALFESTKSKTIIYYANPKSSCLVEEDEEPPHALDTDAKNLVFLISSALESKIFSEIHVMRKTVIDGSNTTGFQRTMLVAQGGHIEIDGKKVGVQSICLEEDAGKLIKDEENHRFFSLDRLGVPLIEIALDPVEGDPKFVKDIALTLGRLLRVTKRVMRGIGSIRQDVNISIEGGGVIEVKGVQQLDQLEKVVEYEAKRQQGLLEISKELQKRDWIHDKEKDRKDITELFSKCKSKIIQNAIKKEHKIFGISFRKMGGIFGFSPYEGIRLGKEIAELVRFFGIGGVFHSDELPNYGVEKIDIENLKEFLKINKEDAFLILAATDKKIHIIIEQIISRIEFIKNNGIPIDTRLATVNGENITIGNVISFRSRLSEEYQSIEDNVLFDGILKQLIQQIILSQNVNSNSRKIKYALENVADTLFLDSDIIITDTINDIDNTKEIGVSPQFIRQEHIDKTGFYNGGMLWTKNMSVPNDWIEFTKLSRYFDQASIEDLARKYLKLYLQPN